MKKILIAAIIGAAMISAVSAAWSKIFLENVAEWKTIAGVTFQWSTFGQAIWSYDPFLGKYSVKTELFSLPKLEQGFFYEWWIVNPANSDAITTGRVFKDVSFTKTRRNAKTSFSIERDLRNYTQYEVSIETNDGNISQSNNLVLQWDIDFRIVQDRTRTNTRVSNKKGASDIFKKQRDSRQESQKLKAQKISTPLNNFNNTTNKNETSVLTKNTIFMPSLETSQQRAIHARLSRLSIDQLKKVDTFIPELKSTLRTNTQLSSTQRTQRLQLIDDVQLSIDILTQ